MIALWLNVVAEELTVDIAEFGSTTYRREDIARGFEPDTSFYIAQAKAVRGKRKLDLTTDPAPDLVVEIDVTASSLDKPSIFARFGIPEVWRYDGAYLTVLALTGNQYVEYEGSAFLPGLTAVAIAWLH